MNLYTTIYMMLLKRYNYCGFALNVVTDEETKEEFYQELQLCESLMHDLAEMIE